MNSLRMLAAATAGAVALAAQSARASEHDIIFYPNNMCYGSLNFFDSEVQVRASCKIGEMCRNDQNRSVWIAPTVKPGTIIKVWDDPNGSTDDDWTQIVIKKVKPNVYNNGGGLEGMCIQSFETSRSGADYELYHRRVNGIDGKISLIQITPAPASTKPVVRLYRPNN